MFILTSLPLIKFSLLLKWPNAVFESALADVIRRACKDCKNKHAVNTAITLMPNACTICAMFLHNWIQCIDSFSLSLHKYVRKGNKCKQLSNSQLFRCYQRKPVKCSTCAVSNKIVIECRIAFLEMRLFLKNHSLEFHEIWHENSLGNK